MVEANEAASYIQELAGENANIIFGAVYDDSVQDSATITVIATGIEDVDVNNAMAGFSNKMFLRNVGMLKSFSVTVETTGSACFNPGIEVSDAGLDIVDVFIDVVFFL